MRVVRRSVWPRRPRRSSASLRTQKTEDPRADLVNTIEDARYFDATIGQKPRRKNTTDFAYQRSGLKFMAMPLMQ
jgi:hypothetical protein